MCVCVFEGEGGRVKKWYYFASRLLEAEKVWVVGCVFGGEGTICQLKGGVKEGGVGSVCVLGAGEDEKLRYSGFMGHKLVLDLSQW